MELTSRSQPQPHGQAPASPARAHLRVAGPSGGDESKFKEINEAYDVLRDPEKRKMYDQVGQGSTYVGVTSARETSRRGELRVNLASVPLSSMHGGHGMCSLYNHSNCRHHCSLGL